MKKYIKVGFIFAFFIGSIFVNANFSKVFATEGTYMKLEDGVQGLYKNEMEL